MELLTTAVAFLSSPEVVCLILTGACIELFKMLLKPRLGSWGHFTALIRGLALLVGGLVGFGLMGLEGILVGCALGSIAAIFRAKAVRTLFRKED